MVNKQDNQIQLDEILSPSLNPSEYATDLAEAFEKINSNFLKLANHDFVKGDIGLSVRIEDKPFVNENNEPTIFAQKLIKCIESASSPAERADVIHNDETITLWDNFNANPGTIQLIYNDNRWLDLKGEQGAGVESSDDEFDMNGFGADTEDIPVPISSMYYIFLDGRFVNDKLGEIDPTMFADIKDLSCILVYDAKATSGLHENVEGDGAFVILANAFPTVYYKNDVGLCWKINGRETGMPVQGIPGKHGDNSRLYIVKCDNLTNDGPVLSGKVNQIFDTYDGWCDISVDDIDELNDKTALIVLPSENKNDANSGFYFGHLRVETTAIDGIEHKNVIGICDNLTNINYSVEIQSVIDAMKSINLYNSGSSTGSEGLKGLFIPINTKAAHLISSTSLTDATEVLPNNDLIITPIEDISATINDPKELIVERYLYLRIDKPRDQGIFNSLNAVNGKLSYSDCEKNNFILKYKLSTALSGKTAYEDISYAKNLKYGYGYYTSDNEWGFQNEPIQLDSSNVGYYEIKVNPDGSVSTTYGESPIISLPWDIRERIDENGDKYNYPVYKWELCNKVHDFDVDELPSKSNDEDNEYGFPDVFKTVYTSTLTPGATTKFAWHNALQIVDDGYFGINDPTNDGGLKNSVYTVPGYYVGDEPLLSFVKFIPVFNNKHEVENIDPTLNINYNVTITGNTSNSKTGLTVHGLVNCENVTSEIISATGEYRNIYTRDNIIDDAGIKIGKTVKNLTGYSCTIDASGNITTDGNVVSTDVSCETVHAENVSTNSVTSDDIHINNSNGENRLFIGDGVTQINDDKSKIISTTISVGNVNDIDIQRVIGISPAKELKDNLTQPLISNSVPSLQTNNSNIIVSNQVKGSEHLYYSGAFGCPNTKNANGEYIGGPGRGATGAPDEIDSPTGVNNDELKYLRIPDFDHVKNYNMYKLQGTQNSYTPASISVYSSDCSVYATDNIGFSINNSDYIAIETYDKFVSDITESCKNDNIDTFNIAKFEFMNNNANNGGTANKLKRNIPIRLQFNNDYVFRLGLSNKCSYARWPVLWKDSVLTLKVYYRIGTGEPKIIDSMNKNILFDGNTTHPEHGKHGNPCNTVSDESGFEWKGFDINGKYHSGNLENEWRYFVYRFRPGQLELSVNDYAFTKIADAYDKGNTVTIYVVPSLYVDARSQRGGSNENKIRKTIKGISLSNFIPVKTFASVPEYSKQVNNTNKIYNVQNLFTKNTMGTNLRGSLSIKRSDLLCTRKDNFAVMYYSYDCVESTNTIKSTTICDDGVVMRAGEYTFGLGYCAYAENEIRQDTVQKTPFDDDIYRKNIPVLFYYKNSKIDFDGVVSPPGPAGTPPVLNPQKFNHKDSMKFYAFHSECIPLDDILNVVRFVKTLCNDNKININDPSTWEKYKLDYVKPEDTPEVTP